MRQTFHGRSRGRRQRSYSPDVSRDENDDGEGTEPGVSDSEEDVARDIRPGKVPERHRHHPKGERKRNQIENPHPSLPLIRRSFPSPRPFSSSPQPLVGFPLAGQRRWNESKRNGSNSPTREGKGSQEGGGGAERGKVKERKVSPLRCATFEARTERASERAGRKRRRRWRTEGPNRLGPPG